MSEKDKVQKEYLAAGGQFKTFDEGLRWMEKAEANGEIILAYNIAWHLLFMDGSEGMEETIERLNKMILDRQCEMLEEGVTGKVTLYSDNLLFRTVCCDRMKDAVINGLVTAAMCDCMTQEIGLFASMPDILKELTAEHEGLYENIENVLDNMGYMDDSPTQLDKCPFCGKEIGEIEFFEDEN